MTTSEMAKHIVEAIDNDPPDNVDPHPELFSDLNDDGTSEALFKIWRKGVIDAEWDGEEGATRWRLSGFGVELHEKGLTRAYITALEDDVRLDADPGTLVDTVRMR